ncbi:MAG TPA: cytochrome b/b6 domain-containing protein [Leptolyngbyaceae cyanobacterium]
MTIAQIKQKKGKKKTDSQHLWFLHWLMAAVFLILFATGFYMADLPRDVAFRGHFYDFHKTLGVVVMSILLGRIFVLLRVIQHKYRRRFPKFTMEWFRTFAFHTGLYSFMLIVPLSGYFFSNSYDKDVVIFGTGIILPRLFPANEAMGALGRSLHFWLSYTFLATVIVHMIDQKKYVRSQWRRFSKAVMRTRSSKAV